MKEPEPNQMLIRKGKLFLSFLIIGSILIAFLAVFLFTRNAISNMFMLTNTGQIGDTIGGITAPIFGLIGFVLVFYSFSEQYKANQIQIESLKQQEHDRVTTEEYNLLESLLTNLDQKIDLFELVESKDSVVSYRAKSILSEKEQLFVTYRGATAMNKFCNEISKTIRYLIKTSNFNLESTDFLPDYYYIIIFAKMIKSKISSSQLDEQKMAVLTSRFDLIYNCKLRIGLLQIDEAYRSINIDIDVLRELSQAYSLLELKN